MTWVEKGSHWPGGEKTKARQLEKSSVKPLRDVYVKLKTGEI